MTDHLVRGLVSGHGLSVIFARVTHTARMARVLHGCYPTSAYLLAQGLAAGALLGALLDPEGGAEKGRVNLRIECDGPFGGLLVDSDPDGNVRASVRRPEVNFLGDPAEGARAALGGSGYLSVIRDFGGGNVHRGAVKLQSFELAEDLRRYFSESEQVATALDVQVVSRPDDPIAEAAGILLQKLPSGDVRALEAARERLAAGAFRAMLGNERPAQEIIREVAGEELELLADLEIAYRCGCSMARARAAVSALGLRGIEDVLAKEKQAVVTCEFCRERYVVPEAELRDMARRLAEQAGE